MAHTHDKFSKTTLAQKSKAKVSWTFSLGTTDFARLGLTNEDDIAQVRAGGRFDLAPWRGWKPTVALFAKETPMSILHDASAIVDYLYLQLDLSAGGGHGDITATYNPEPNAAMRRALNVDLSQP